MGSKRFPGKMMEVLGRHTILEWVLRRTSRSETLDGVILATSSAPENRVLQELAEGLSIPTLCGSEDDVLSRFILAAEKHGADHVVRICADNPFVAPEEIDRLTRFYLDRLPDYAFNHIPKMGNMYPDGLGAEIFSSALLRQVAESTTETRYREHVTLYLWDHAQEFRIETLPAPLEIAFPDVKLDVDTQEDLSLLRRILPGLDIESPAVDIVNSFRFRV
jgi:spore coat polysaccharide biosynthesis protein SpsF